MTSATMDRFGDQVFLSSADNHHRKQINEYFMADLNISDAVNDYRDNVAVADTRNFYGGNTSS